MSAGFIVVFCCRYFIHGVCREGSRCLFSHDLTNSKPSTICKFYQRGVCAYGERCRWDRTHLFLLKSFVQPASQRSSSGHKHNLCVLFLGMITSNLHPEGGVLQRRPPVEAELAEEKGGGRLSWGTEVGCQLLCPKTRTDELRVQTSSSPQMPPLPAALGPDGAFGGSADGLDFLAAAAAPQSYVDAIRTGLDTSTQDQGEAQTHSFVWLVVLCNAISNRFFPVFLASQPTMANALREFAPLCPYAANGHCFYEDTCTYLHGDQCDVCGLQALHPYDPEQRRAHEKVCMLVFVFLHPVWLSVLKLLHFLFLSADMSPCIWGWHGKSLCSSA